MLVVMRVLQGRGPFHAGKVATGNANGPGVTAGCAEGFGGWWQVILIGQVLKHDMM